MGNCTNPFHTSTTMEEQKELDELKETMTEQQKKLADTMAAMELKATALQEKLDRKSELSQSNAKAGITKIALEYKVVELDMSLKPPPGFKFGDVESSGNRSGKSHQRTGYKKAFVTDKSTVRPTGGAFDAKQTSASFFEKSEQEPIIFGGGTFPDVTSKEFEEQAVMKDMKQEARERLSEFETTKLKVLGEEGWTLRSVVEVYLEPDTTTYRYYFSRPL